MSLFSLSNLDIEFVGEIQKKRWRILTNFDGVVSELSALGDDDELRRWCRSSQLAVISRIS